MNVRSERIENSMIDAFSDLIPPSPRNCDTVFIDLMMLESIDQMVFAPNSDDTIPTVNLAAGKSSILGLRSVESRD
jgi:hypothetical protein